MAKVRSDLLEEEMEAQRSNLMFQTILQNTLKLLDPRINSSGFRTYPQRHRSAMIYKGNRVAETFLLNTQLQRYDREIAASVQHYSTDSALTMLSLNGLETVHALEEIELPPSPKLSMQLSKCLAYRRSRRVFTGEPMKLSHLAAIVRAGAKITDHLLIQLSEYPELEPVSIGLRSAPSPGALYGIDLYIVVQNVAGLAQGIYFYQPRTDKLWLLSREQQDGALLMAVRNAFVHPDELISHSQANVFIFLAIRLWKVIRKYGDRGLRYLLIEIGEITENIHLAVTALGFGSVEVAGFYDSEVNEILGLDGSTSSVLHSIIIGLPAEV